MFFNVLAGIIIFLGLLALYGALRTLVRRGWLLAWVRGMVGMVFLGVSLVLVLVALDLLSYDSMTRDKSIAMISFERTGNKTYRAQVSMNGEPDERTFVLKGDQWQMDARIIRWKGLVTKFGAKPGYRLDRLSGRYYSLADERSAERTAYALSSGGHGVDFWRWVQEHGQYLPWVEAVYGSATFVPMAHGALYEVSLTSTGLAARPLNEPAQSALKRWD